jgi:hypothetical protein
VVLGSEVICADIVGSWWNVWLDSLEQASRMRGR